MILFPFQGYESIVDGKNGRTRDFPYTVAYRTHIKEEDEYCVESILNENHIHTSARRSDFIKRNELHIYYRSISVWLGDLGSKLNVTKVIKHP